MARMIILKHPCASEAAPCSASSTLLLPTLPQIPPTTTVSSGGATTVNVVQTSPREQDRQQQAPLPLPSSSILPQPQSHIFVSGADGCGVVSGSSISTSTKDYQQQQQQHLEASSEQQHNPFHHYQQQPLQHSLQQQQYPAAASHQHQYQQYHYYQQQHTLLYHPAQYVAQQRQYYYNQYCQQQAQAASCYPGQQQEQSAFTNSATTSPQGSFDVGINPILPSCTLSGGTIRTTPPSSQLLQLPAPKRISIDTSPLSKTVTLSPSSTSAFVAGQHKPSTTSAATTISKVLQEEETTRTTTIQPGESVTSSSESSSSPSSLQKPSQSKPPSSSILRKMIQDMQVRGGNMPPPPSHAEPQPRPYRPPTVSRLSKVKMMTTMTMPTTHHNCDQQGGRSAFRPTPSASVPEAGAQYNNRPMPSSMSGLPPFGMLPSVVQQHASRDAAVATATTTRAPSRGETTATTTSSTRRCIRASPFEPLVLDRNLPKDGTITPLKFDEYMTQAASSTNSTDCVVAPLHVGCIGASAAPAAGPGHHPYHQQYDNSEYNYNRSTNPRDDRRQDHEDEEVDDSDYSDDDDDHDCGDVDDDTIASIPSTPPPLQEVHIHLSELAEQGMIELSKDDWKTLYLMKKGELEGAKQHSNQVLQENRMLKRQLIEMQKNLFESRRNGLKRMRYNADNGEDINGTDPMIQPSVNNTSWTIPEYSSSARSNFAPPPPPPSSMNKRTTKPKIESSSTMRQCPSSSVPALITKCSSSPLPSSSVSKEGNATTTKPRVLHSVSHDESCVVHKKAVIVATTANVAPTPASVAK